MEKRTDTPLIDLIEERLRAEDLAIPVFPAAAASIQREMGQEEPDLKKVERYILSDQALTSEVLKTANSAFFAGLEKVTDLRAAVVRLGGREVLNLVMTASQKNQYTFAEPELQEVADALWRHALGTAVGARWLARRTGHRSLATEAFLAGLLHDVGKLFLLTVLDDLRRRGRTGFNPQGHLVREVLDRLHTREGARLLQLWNLPDAYREIAGGHHDPELDRQDILGALVRQANLTCHKLGIGMKSEPHLLLGGTMEAQQLRLTEITTAEMEVELEDAMARLCPTPQS